MTKVLEPANSTGGATSLSPRLASDTAASAAGSFAAVSIIVIQVLLIARLIGRYQLESPSFYRIILIALGGFLVHHLLPLRFRLSFFVLLCLVAPFLVMGFDQDGHIYEPGLITAAWLVGIGLGITTICLLRIGYWWKVGLLISVGAVLAALRKGWIPAQSLSLIWPILGSMFMFRVIVYIYDTHHDAKQPGILNTIAYFFLLPNICFPLFPVVDFKSFYRNYYKTDPILIYQKGFAWMTRGIIHLLLYRFVYYNFYITSGMVASGTDLIHFLITNVLLYLRVSGEFHIVIGIMQLFGFDLPETNRLYFLASSFTDYWRRVNIYWKDFILKVFYYPAAFRLKKWGPTRSLVAATLFCFLIAWLLHSYQWFWIQGNFPITGQDSLFWGLLGLLVTVNAVREARHGRQRSLTPPRKTWRSRASLALRTAATFAIVTILWSLWSSDSLDNWLWIWTCADWWTAFYGLIALGVIAVGAILFDTRWMAQLRISPGVARSPSSFKIREAFITGFLPLCILYAPTTGLISSRMPGAAQQLFSSLQNPRPTEVDEDALVRGYYENLMDISRSNPQLEQLLKQRPADWQHLEDTDIVRFTGDFRYHELVPSKRVVINGQTITTNSWGMRDREYTLEKPAGTFRIALLDASTAMGLGVNDNETFENVLEQMLNAHRPVGQYRSYEVLDFGVNGFSIVCDLMTLENKAMAFHPDAVFVLGNATDDYWLKQRLARAVRAHTAIPYDYLGEAIIKARIDARTPEQAAERRLNPYWPELMAETMHRIVEVSRSHGAVPVWFLLPGYGDVEGARQKRGSELERMAMKAGFVVWDVHDVFAGQGEEKLVVAPWDHHPNALGHRLLAERLYRVMCDERSKIFTEMSAKSTRNQKKEGSIE